MGGHIVRGGPLRPKTSVHPFSGASASVWCLIGMDQPFLHRQLSGDGGQGIFVSGFGALGVLQLAGRWVNMSP